MTGSSPVTPQSASHGRPYGAMPLRCWFCVLALPTWSAAWGRCAAWRHSPDGGPCLQSRLAGSTSVTTAFSAGQAQGQLLIHCFANDYISPIHPFINPFINPFTCWFICSSVQPLHLIHFLTCSLNHAFIHHWMILSMLMLMYIY